MNDERDGGLRRLVRVDPRRYPLLAQWMTANPYYWQDAMRAVMEAELAAGRVAMLLPSAPPRRKPRGISALRKAEAPAHITTQALVDAGGALHPVPPHPGTEDRPAPPAATLTSAGAKRDPSGSDRPVGAQKPPPVVQGAAQPAYAPPAAVANHAVASSERKSSMEPPHKTYAPEPAAHSVASEETPAADAALQAAADREAEIKAQARRALLDNEF